MRLRLGSAAWLGAADGGDAALDLAAEGMSWERVASAPNLDGRGNYLPRLVEKENLIFEREGSALVLLTLYLLHRLPVASDHYSSLTLVWTGDFGLLDEVAGALGDAAVDIKHRTLSRRPGDGECRAVLNLKCRNGEDLEGLVRGIQADERLTNDQKKALLNVYESFLAAR